MAIKRPNHREVLAYLHRRWGRTLSDLDEALGSVVEDAAAAACAIVLSKQKNPRQEIRDPTSLARTIAHRLMKPMLNEQIAVHLFGERGGRRLSRSKVREYSCELELRAGVEHLCYRRFQDSAGRPWDPRDQRYMDGGLTCLVSRLAQHTNGEIATIALLAGYWPRMSIAYPTRMPPSDVVSTTTAAVRAARRRGQASQRR